MKNTVPILHAIPITISRTITKVIFKRLNKLFNYDFEEGYT